MATLEQINSVMEMLKIAQKAEEENQKKLAEAAKKAEEDAKKIAEMEMALVEAKKVVIKKPVIKKPVIKQELNELEFVKYVLKDITSPWINLIPPTNLNTIIENWLNETNYVGNKEDIESLLQRAIAKGYMKRYYNYAYAVKLSYLDEKVGIDNNKYQYISTVKSGSFAVRIDRKHIGSSNDIETAIKIRDDYLKHREDAKTV